MIISNLTITHSVVVDTVNQDQDAIKTDEYREQDQDFMLMKNYTTEENKQHSLFKLRFEHSNISLLCQLF